MSEARSIPAETLLQQAIASDPAISAWASANAGSGKTYVLSRRVIRLLLAGVAPGRILCLTYTKAAAAEMSNRIFGTLGQWAVAPRQSLAAQLATLTGRQPDAAAVERARTLFALALDTPGGLKVQTIHAFCEALLHQFPLEANVPGHFEVIEELRQQELVAEARRLTLGRIDAGDERLRDAFGFLVDHFSEYAIDRALSEIVSLREAFDSWAGGDIDAAMAPLWGRFDIAPGGSADLLMAEMLADSALRDADLAAIAAEARAAGGRNNIDFATTADAMLRTTTPQDRFRLRNKLFLTNEGTLRKRPVTKAVLAGIGEELARKLGAEAERVPRDRQRIADWRMLTATHCLFTFADALLARYQSLKRRGGLVDFADLIGRAANLLQRSQVREWVRYKLDRGIDHVLIDEAQDTSPKQWQIVEAIVSEFHAGIGARGETRTVFAVGDEKQSIFSFQGADPAGFARQAREVERRAKGAGMAFETVRLRLSFRSTPDILGAVDRVFSVPENARGLSAGGEAVDHQAIRASDPGEVCIWPLEAAETPPAKTDWLAPLDVPLPGDPAVTLARRIAATISGWIGRAEKLPGADRPIRHGDILILVRRRDRFMTAVIRELKERGLAIAGADRLKLTEHIAVEDLMALGRVMVMPEDDLSLAAVLKSPLFGVGEEELLALCAGRDGLPLHEHLRRLGHLAAGEAAAREAVAGLAARMSERLEAMRRVARRETVHGFYAHVLGRMGGRRAFAGRLGSEAAEPLDAFEAATLDHERQGGAGLEDFIAGLARAAPEIKREADMRRDEVRVLTVHGAKGLEAPIVFLVDPCSPAFVTQHAPSIIEFAGEGYLWVPSVAQAGEIVRARLAEIRDRAEEEYRRLLYVGMTRAADRLIVCGYRGVREPPRDHWHAMVERALAPEAQAVRDAEGKVTALIWRHPGAATRERPLAPAAADAAEGVAAAPAWLTVDAPPEPALPRPLNPSGAMALAGEPAPLEPSLVPPDAAGLGAAGQERRLSIERGTAVHRLLQILPEVEPGGREALGRAWLGRNFAGLETPLREQILTETLGLVGRPELATLFGVSSRAEVAVAGNVDVGGREVAVSGQIDRMAVTAHEVVIADFKTNRTVPATIPLAYALQLALYRALMAGIYPGRRVRCMIIWTREATVSEASDAELEAALARITLP